MLIIIWWSRKLALLIILILDKLCDSKMNVVFLDAAACELSKSETQSAVVPRFRPSFGSLQSRSP